MRQQDTWRRFLHLQAQSQRVEAQCDGGTLDTHIQSHLPVWQCVLTSLICHILLGRAFVTASIDQNALQLQH